MALPPITSPTQSLITAFRPRVTEKVKKICLLAGNSVRAKLVQSVIYSRNLFYHRSMLGIKFLREHLAVPNINDAIITPSQSLKIAFIPGMAEKVKKTCLMAGNPLKAELVQGMINSRNLMYLLGVLTLIASYVYYPTKLNINQVCKATVPILGGLITKTYVQELIERVNLLKDSHNDAIKWMGELKAQKAAQEEDQNDSFELKE